MASRFPFFNSYNPLIKSDPIFIKEKETSPKGLTLRPVWIIGDLEILHDWMNASLRKSNWVIDPKRHSLFRHYKQILVADIAQSLIYEQNCVPCMQFDILPHPGNNWPNRIKYTKNEYYLNFLFRENFRDPDLFVRGVGFLLECMRTLSNIFFLYVRLLQSDKYMHEQLKAIGFESVNYSPFGGKTLPVYRLKLRR